MKAGKTIYHFIKKPVLLLTITILFSCGTYNTGIADIENKLYNGKYKEASAEIDKNKFLLKDRNRLLYLLEKGKVEHLNSNYQKSNELLEQAYILIDDRIKTNVAQAAAAKFTSPMAEPYKGEDFEKVTLHYYKALNYFHLGMPNEALVEAKRINIKLYELNQKYTEGKNKYSEDAFSQILQGILYESTGDINNAFIAYRNAEEIYTKNDGKYFGVTLPLQLKKDLLRTTAQLGFTQEYLHYKQKYSDVITTTDTTSKTNNAPKGEAIIFWENGLGPVKDQSVITLSVVSGLFVGTYYDGEQNHEIVLPVPPGKNIGSINAIAIPRYRNRGTYYTGATVQANNIQLPLELVQDFYPIARQNLKDRMARELLDMALRFAAKKAASAGLASIGKELLGDTGGDIVKLGADIGGAATEKADTRNWQTLPSTISYVRIPLVPGDNKITISKRGAQGIDTDTITIAFKPGLQIINYFDLGRTEIIPQVANPVISNNKL